MDVDGIGWVCTVGVAHDELGDFLSFSPDTFFVIFIVVEVDMFVAGPSRSRWLLAENRLGVAFGVGGLISGDRCGHLAGGGCWTRIADSNPAPALVVEMESFELVDEPSPRACTPSDVLILRLGHTEGKLCRGLDW